MEAAGLVLGFASVASRLRRSQHHQSQPRSIQSEEDRIIRETGIRVLVKPEKPTVDLVLVHGLQGHPVNTWDSDDCSWPRELLQRDVPTARILSFGYAALLEPGQYLSFKDLGQLLLVELSKDRDATNASTRPICFAAHSLGGLVVKAAMVRSFIASPSIDKRQAQLLLSTKAVFFLGCPQGNFNRATWSLTLSKIRDWLKSYQPEVLMRTAVTLSTAEDEDVFGINEMFDDIARTRSDLQRYYFYETKHTATKKGKLLIVGKSDSRPQMLLPNDHSIAVNTDHENIAKVHGRNETLYFHLTECLSAIVADALTTKPLLINPTIIRGVQQGLEVYVTSPKTVSSSYKENVWDFENSYSQSDLPEKERIFLSRLQVGQPESNSSLQHQPDTCQWVLATEQWQQWNSSQAKFLWIVGGPGMGKTVLTKFILKRLQSNEQRKRTRSWQRFPDALLGVGAGFPTVNSSPSVGRMTEYNKKPDFGGASLKQNFEIIQCQDCAQVFESVSEFNQHMTFHDLAPPYSYREPTGSSEGLSSLKSSQTQLPEPRESDVRITLAYACSLADTGSQNSRKVVRSLLYQLLAFEKSLFKHVYACQMFEELQLDDVSFASHSDLFETMLQDKSIDRIDIIIDALDEYSNSDQSQLMKLFRRLAKNPQVYLILTCRTSPILEPNPASELCLHITSEAIGRDLTIFIENELNKLIPRTQASKSLRSKIKTWMQTMLPSASFLWIRLTLHHLAQQTTMGDTSRLLETTPTVDSLLESCILQSQQPDLMFLALLLVMGAIRPLSIEEFFAFLVTARYLSAKDSTNKRDNLSEPLKLDDLTSDLPLDLKNAFTQFHPLLEERANGVYFMHQRLVEFLHNRDMSGLQLTPLPGLRPKANNVLDLIRLHDMMGEICIRYICSYFQNNDDRLSFGKYAAIHWVDHVKKASVNNSEGMERVYEPLLTFLGTYDQVNENTIFGHWIRYFCHEAKHFKPTLFDSGTSANAACAAFDMLGLLGNHLDLTYDLRSDIQNKRPDGNTILHIAAANNSVHSIKWMGTQIQTEDSNNLKSLLRCRNNDNMLPAHLAVQFGHIEALEALLSIKTGSMVYSPSLLEQATPDTPELIIDSLKVNRLLLPDRQTFYHAVRLNIESLIKDLLLQRVNNRHGAKLLATISDFFLAAVEARSIPVAEDLIRNWEADVNYCSDDHGTYALHISTNMGDENMVAFLLKEGAWIDAADNYGMTALHLASEKGYDRLVSKLLDKGSMVDLVDIHDCIPLHYASKKGQTQTALRLLEGGSDISHSDQLGNTPLHLAAIGGHETTVRLLVEKGADVMCANNHGESVLLSAVSSGNVDIVRMLLMAGADARAQDDSGVTCIDLAQKIGATIIVKLLTEIGAT